MTWYFLLGWSMMFIPTMIEIKRKCYETWERGYVVATMLYVIGMAMLLIPTTWVYGWGMMVFLYGISLPMFWQPGTRPLRFAMDINYVVIALALTWRGW